MEVSSDVVTKSNGTSPLSVAEGTEKIGGSPNLKFYQVLQRIGEQLSRDEDKLNDIGAFYSEEEISIKSGLTGDEQNYGGSGGMQCCSNNYAK